jgi:hypothetical protein
MEQWWNDDYLGKTEETRRKSCSIATSTTTTIDTALRTSQITKLSLI